jgi:hypothetical protein
MKRKEYHFGDLDTEDEIIAAFEDLENRVANEFEAIEVELSRCVKQKKSKKKGFVMNRVVVSIAVLAIIGGLVFTVAQAAYVRDDINYDIASNPDLLQQYLRDVLAESTYWRFTPQTSAPSGSDLAEGVLYYNDTTNKLMVSTDGSTFTPLESAAGNSLDSAYDAGNGITVDGSAVTLTTGAAVNNVALAIVHGETTNDNDAFTIANSADAATAVSIQIDGTAGYDIQGTADSWNISIAGAASLVGITNTAGDVLFDDTYDLSWDTSRDQLLFEDNAVLGIGGAHDAAGDVTFKWDATNLLIESAAEDTGEIRYGSTNAIDVAHYANTATSIAMFNANTATLEFNGYDVQIQDADILAWGDSDDVTMAFDGTGGDLDILGSGLEIAFGADDEGIDLVWHTETSGDSVTFDESGMDIDIVDVDVGLDDSAILQLGTSDDITLQFDGTDFLIDAITASEALKIGDVTTGFDITYYFETAGQFRSDYDADFINLTDDMDLRFGTGASADGDFQISSSSANLLTIGQVVAGTGSIAIGADDAGLDVKFFGDTASQYLLWDTSEDTLTSSCGNISFTTVDAEADGFKVDATGAVAGDAINLETTDGGIMLNADGNANGDIELNSADDMIITSAGDTTITTTGTLSLGGSQVTNTLVALETVTTQTNAVAATESGTVYNVVYTGTHTTTLPQAAPGLIFTIIDGSSTAADDVIVDIQAGDNIEGDTNGDGIQCVTDEEGSSITLVAITSTRWIVLSTTGTWAAQ